MGIARIKEYKKMNFSDQHHKILQKALDVWGEHTQYSMAVGELGELLTLYGRRVQGRDVEEDWISEIADVIIILEQLARMHGYDKVCQKIEYKMERLSNRLDPLKKIDD